MGKEDKIQEIVEICLRLQRPADGSAWHRLGLSHAQIGMLYTLFFHKNASVKQIALNLDISTSAVTQLVEPLLRKGLVSRRADTKDRRIAHLELTAKGTATLKKFKKIKAAGFRTALEKLNTKEINSFYELAQKMAPRTQ